MKRIAEARRLAAVMATAERLRLVSREGLMSRAPGERAAGICIMPVVPARE